MPCLPKRTLAVLALACAPPAGSACAPDERPPRAKTRVDPGVVVSAPFPDVRSFSDVLVLDGERAYIVGTDGTILRRVEETWSNEESGTDADLMAIDGFVDDEGIEHLLAVGAGGTVLLREEGTWRKLQQRTDALLFSVCFRRVDDAFIVGEAGSILRYDGTDTVVQTAQTFQTVLGSDGSVNEFPIAEALKGVGDAGVILAVGARGAVYAYDPDGEPLGETNRWVREDSDTSRPLANVFTEAGVWAPTTEGVLLHRNGDGTWDDDVLRAPAPVFLQDVWAGGGQLFTVGLAEDLYHLDDEGAWRATRVALGAELRAIDGHVEPPEDDDEAPKVEVIAVGSGGRIVRGPRVLPREGEVVLETRDVDPAAR